MLIIVQGPFIKNTKNLVKTLSNLFPKNKIIVSCYQEIIDDYLIKTLKNVEFIHNSDPGSIFVPPRGKPLNLKRQAKTIHSACIRSNEEWVMKIRSDLSIVDERKFIKSFKKIESCFFQNPQPKLITLDNGSLDIFSYYDMIFHFNDWFFVCKRRILLENCSEINKINEQSLIDPFKNRFPKNYYHNKRYRLLFHNEQMIHFAKFLLSSRSIRHCCDNSKITKFRHLIWVAKFLKIFTLRDLGMKSSKSGYASLRTQLVAISFKSLDLHKILIRSRGTLRVAIFSILQIHGFLRKVLFLVLGFFSKIKIELINKVKLLILH